MILSIIVAAAENNVIGRDNTLIWHLSADLKHFKQLTTGHTVVMGRNTFDSIGKALPQRRNIILTRNAAFSAEGCEIAGNMDEVMEMVKNEDEVFIIGGGAVYRECWERADKLYLTRVHTQAEGDTLIPAVDNNRWELVSKQDFSADEKNEFDYSFMEYRRI